MSGLFTQDISGCFPALDEGTYQQCLAELAPALSDMKQRRCPQTAALLHLPEQTDDLEEIRTLAQDIRAHYKHVVVCGSGGSGLSGRIFAQLSTPSIDMHCIENIDPVLMQKTLARIDIQASYFIVISKSGTTVEALSQFYVWLDQVKQAGGTPAKQCVVITMDTDNPLKQAATHHHMRHITHPADIGGRFSPLTAVGLLPAALCGLDIAALRKGAQGVVAALDSENAIHACLAAQGAALHVAAIKAGRNTSVMWPYGEQLSGFASWYRQSWAESLGKSGKGSTPITAMGSTDQHSQLQLFLDGPKDKLFHFITLPRQGTGAVIAAPESLPHLAGKTLGDVMEAQQTATLAALKKNHCPVRHIALQTLDERTFGALLMQGVLEILFAATLLKVNPFDQPAVEESKELARRWLAGKAA